MMTSRLGLRLGAAGLLIVMAAEAMAAVTPGTPVRVSTHPAAGGTAERYEGVLVHAGEDVTLVTREKGDTLRFDYADLERVEVAVAPGRSGVATGGGAMLGGLLGLLGAAGYVHQHDSSLSSQQGVEIMVISAGLGAFLVGGIVGRAPSTPTLRWHEITKSELRASE